MEGAVARYFFLPVWIENKNLIFVTDSDWWSMTWLRRKERRRRRRLLAKIGSGLQESQIGDGDGEFGIIYAQVPLLLLPVDIPC